MYGNSDASKPSQPAPYGAQPPSYGAQPAPYGGTAPGYSQPPPSYPSGPQPAAYPPYPPPQQPAGYPPPPQQHAAPPGVPGSDGSPIVGAVVAGAPCHMTRDELQRVLQDSQYGANAMAFDTTFVRAADGQPLCRTCNQPIGHHGDGSSLAHQRAGTAVGHYAPPNVFPRDIVAEPLDKVQYQMVPPHWSTSAWYAPLISFHSWGRERSRMVGSRKNRRMVYNVTAVWQCTAPLPDGRPCGHQFETYGCDITESGGSMRTQIINMQPANEEDAQQDPNKEMMQPYFERHFREVHHLAHQSPGMFATSISDVCAHKGALCSCLMCYCWMNPCPGPNTGYSFCGALDQVLPMVLSGNPMMRALPRDQPQCDSSMLCGLCMLPFLPHFIVAYTLMTVYSILTCCGFPCGEDENCAPCMCICCFAHRRRLVKALGAPESVQQSRCYSVFCCPCSELQVWRELYNSGVWPGLLCRGATAQEVVYMEPSAVRDRYNVRATITAEPAGDVEGARLARMVPEYPAPPVAVRMS